MSLTKLSLAGELLNYSLPARVYLAGYGKNKNLFLQCILKSRHTFYHAKYFLPVRRV
jgi:hypothetical protein